MTPLHLFDYLLAIAGGVLCIGFAVLLVLFVYWAIVGAGVRGNPGTASRG